MVPNRPASIIANAIEETEKKRENLHGVVESHAGYGLGASSSSERRMPIF